MRPLCKSPGVLPRVSPLDSHVIKKKKTRGVHEIITLQTKLSKKKGVFDRPNICISFYMGCGEGEGTNFRNCPYSQNWSCMVKVKDLKRKKKKTTKKKQQTQKQKTRERKHIGTGLYTNEV